VAKRYVRGDRAFGRLLKQLPDTVANELRGQLEATGRRVLGIEQRRAPVRTGALQTALSYAVTPKRLSLKVGLVGKPINRKLYYGWFVEWGRKGGGRGVKRGSAKYNAGVGAMGPRHFVFIAGLRDQIYPGFRNIWNEALIKAGSGVSDD
jgi:hypothetical protein